MGAVCKKLQGGPNRVKKDDGKIHGLTCDHGVIDNPGRIQEFYDVDKRRLGEGSFAAVFPACNKSTGFERAIKLCSKDSKSEIPKFLEEIHVMKHLDHPNIIKYYESFQDLKFIYIVMGICKGAELFDLIVLHGHLTEAEVANIMQQVFRGVTYMHTVGICHRDLKTENFMLYHAEDAVELVEQSVKIIDFGLACFYDQNFQDTGEAERLTLKCGGPFYVAPQVLAGDYNYMADVWSVGVLMYTLFAGYPPFFGQTDADVLGNVRLGNYQFNNADFKSVTPEAKNVIRGLLKINPAERMTTGQALTSPWLTVAIPKSYELPLKNQLVSMLRSFAGANKLKRAALYVIAGSLNDEETKPSVDSFNMMDVEGDGTLGFEEIFNGLIRAGIKDPPEELETILTEMDSDGSGQIEFTEFLSATIDRKYITEDNVWSAFRVFDQNGDGKISQTEMYRILNQRADEGTEAVCAKEVVALMTELSSDGDNYVDFPEFLTMMCDCELTSGKTAQRKRNMRETMRKSRRKEHEMETPD